MPSYRVDNGEWHDVHLDRHDNELTLRVDGGGGRREVTGSPGRSREIVIDPALVMLGSSFPSGHNKSFQGEVQVCFVERDARRPKVIGLSPDSSIVLLALLLF